MSSDLAAPAPMDSRVANLSPLHLQLLLMLGSSAESEPAMQEAAKVQRLLQRIEPPQVQEENKKHMQAQQKSADKKKPKSAKSSPSPPPSAIAPPSDDPAVAWSPASVAKLSASSDPLDTLLLAMLCDPANPWHPTLRDAEKSLRLYGLAAIKLPSAYACARLAHFYLTGTHTGGKDEAKGCKWLRMGAARGHALCQYQLAFALEDGRLGLKRDVAQAVEWYEKAAALKYPQAMFNLSTLLLEPQGTHEGVTQDIVRGIRLMEDAAALGDVSAQLKLGHLCFLGDKELDVEADVARCIQYLTLAAHNPDDPSVDAAKILGIVYSTAETNSYENPHYDLERSIRYLRIAADAGDENSRVLLQRQLAKQAKVEKGIVLDRSSAHLEAMRKLAIAEGKANGAGGAADELAEVTRFLTQTPSAESLYLALARLHSRFPSYGSARLHAALKAEYPHWEVSEKRVKKVMKEHGWSAEGATAPAAVTPLDSSATPTPAIVLAEAGGPTKQRINEKAIVNDLD